MCIRDSYYAVQVTEFGTSRKLICDFILPVVINTNLPLLLHHFRDTFDKFKIAIVRLHLLRLTPSPDGGVPLDDLRKILPGCQGMAKVPNGVATLPKISIA